jgi:two-component system sensor histidine kinase KdpD
MLKAAHQRQSEGVDVVVAHVAPHGDPSTEALLQGLEVLPHAIDTSELNLDILLARHPQLILLDDLAVTNSPHGQHRKRYQDAEELLHAGIDVYATLNIQHLESLNEVIAQLTGVVVAETIPDRGSIKPQQRSPLSIFPPTNCYSASEKGKSTSHFAHVKALPISSGRRR